MARKRTLGKKRKSLKSRNKKRGKTYRKMRRMRGGVTRKFLIKQNSSYDDRDLICTLEIKAMMYAIDPNNINYRNQQIEYTVDTINNKLTKKSGSKYNITKIRILHKKYNNDNDNELTDIELTDIFYNIKDIEIMMHTEGLIKNNVNYKLNVDKNNLTITDKNQVETVVTNISFKIFGTRIVTP